MDTGNWVLAISLGLSCGQADKVYTLRERHIQIPIMVQPEKRGELRELILFVSKDQGQTWNMAALAKPDDAAFPFHASADGPYWFKVCAVDKSGGREPVDIYAAPVNMKVVIDSQRQILRIVAAERVGDDVHVAWETVGSQPDLLTLKLEYRASDLGPNTAWQPVALDPSAVGQKRFRPTTAGPLAIKLQVSDQNGTPAVVVKELPAAIVATPVFSATSNTNPITAAPSPVVQQSNSIPATAPGTAPVPGGAPLPAPVLPQDVPSPVASSAPQPPAPGVPPSFGQSNSGTETVTPPSGPGLTPLPSAKTANDTSAQPGGHPSAASPAGVTSPGRPNDVPELQHVKDDSVTLEFELDRTGPSGVKKIEVYITQDDGRTWRTWMETYESKSPLQLPLPRRPYEGTFGFKLVPYSGVLQTVGPPQSGDAPDVRLHVDRTPPKVELFALEPDSGQMNAVVLRYQATDANLATGGVSLYWTSNPGRPWLPIQAGPARPVSGYVGVQECTWMLPPDLPNKVYLRIAARDQAGNVGEKTTRDPVTVDLHKPTVSRVKALVAAKPAATPPVAAPVSLLGGPQP